MHLPRVLTWHIHGSYLYYLAHARAEFYVPLLPGRPPRFVGLPTGGYPWPANLHEVPAESIPTQQEAPEIPPSSQPGIAAPIEPGGPPTDAGSTQQIARDPSAWTGGFYRGNSG